MSKKIYLSPSDQTANVYAYGNTTEAVQCRYIADAAEAGLKRCGFEVINNQSSSMKGRVAESNKWKSDLHVPIHTNAANKSASGTRLFSWDTSGEGYKACQAIFAVLAPLTPGTSENIKANKSLYEINSANAPTTYIEVDFHDVPAVAEWIINNVVSIGEAIAEGICRYFNVKYVGTSSQQTPPQSPQESKGSAAGAVPMLSVIQRQRNLKHYYAYYTGKADGIEGALTARAYRAFQKANGLTPDGIYGPLTNAKLIEKVKGLQRAVGVTADGMVGPKTIAAIKAYQKANGLVQDGIAGTATFKRINGKKPTGTVSANPAAVKDGYYSAHFARREFKCRCQGRYCSGYPVEMDSRVIAILEKLRAYYGKPITITSGIRCKKYNDTIAGASRTSAHLRGKAADFYIPGACDTAAGREAVKEMCYKYGAVYSYCNTVGMGNTVHLNV